MFCLTLTFVLTSVSKIVQKTLNTQEHNIYSLRDTRRPTYGLMVSVLGMVFVPFLASFGLQCCPVWHHLGPRATLLGLMAHMWGPGPKVV